MSNNTKTQFYIYYQWKYGTEWKGSENVGYNL